jgi:hypothetical protein
MHEQQVQPVKQPSWLAHVVISQPTNVMTTA